MDWFRMYNEIVYDPKVIRLSDRQHRAWVNLLAIASMNSGVLPSVEDVALYLRTTNEKAEFLLRDLCNRGFFDATEHGIEPHNWKQRQYVSDCSTPRVRKHRKQFQKQDVTVSETPSEQNRTETEQKQNRAEQTAPDFSEWIERVKTRHPKNAGMEAGVRLLIENLDSAVNPVSVAADIEEKHKAWCAHWAEDGNRFSKRLDKWVSEGAYLDWPPSNGKVTTCITQPCAAPLTPDEEADRIETARKGLDDPDPQIREWAKQYLHGRGVAA